MRGYEHQPQDMAAVQQPVRTRRSAQKSGGGSPLRGAVTPQMILALQRSVGNATVVRLLDQRRHACDPSHRHQGDRGHQGRQDDQAVPAAPAVQRSSVPAVLRASGKPMPDALRTEMETRLGADFKDVRLHDDTAAARSAREVGARAYTSRNHVVIGEGGADKHTLAHELTHVLQQRSGPVAGTDNGGGLRVSDPGDRFERAAEANATRVMRDPSPVQRSASSGSAGSTCHGGAERLERLTTDPGGAGELAIQRALDYTAAPANTDVRHWAGTSGGLALTSQMLTDGSLKGSVPQQDPLGYGYIRSLGLTKTWIRFHLVNNIAGGPGTANNLVPGSASDNSTYEHNIEQALKSDVSAASANAGDYVWFGVEVTYGHTPGTGASALELANAGAFPTGLNVYHKYYDGSTNSWAWKKNGTAFNFSQRQPHDTTVPTNLNTLTLAQLQQYTGYGASSRAWDNEDASFLNAIATGGARNAEFTTLLGGGTSADNYYNAFYRIVFRKSTSKRAAAQTGGTTFGMRIEESRNGDTQGGGPLQTLSFCLAAGRLIL